MSYAQDNGYTAVPFSELMNELRLAINRPVAEGGLGTSYTEETFVGTGLYKYAYAVLQKSQENEVKTAEIFQKLQEYIATTNAKIKRPSVSQPGLIEQFDDAGYVASVKPPVDVDAGKIFVCVDLDDTDPDYATERLAVATLIKDFVAGGLVTQGTEEEEITLSNGQEFTFKFYLPDRIPVLLRLTAVDSENSLAATPTDEELRQAVFDNAKARYKLGMNFEPQRYFGQSDAPWAQSVLLEWSDDAGATWNSTVFDAAFDELFEFGLEDIQVVIS